QLEEERAHDRPRGCVVPEKAAEAIEEVGQHVDHHERGERQRERTEKLPYEMPRDDREKETARDHDDASTPRRPRSHARSMPRRSWSRSSCVSVRSRAACTKR